LRALRAAPFGLACWLGIAGGAERNNGCARVLMFHGTPRHRVRNFERMLRYLKSHFDLVPLERIAADAAALGVRFRGQLALTFDDGLRNNVEVAYPLLSALGIPATFFVCPELVERRRWLWNHEARQRLNRLPREAIRWHGAELGCAADVESVIAWMKAAPLAERERVEERIRRQTPAFSPSAEERHEFDLASWDELRRLDPQVVTIGSHTLTHAILPSLDAEQAEHEMAGSRRMLEAKLQRSVDLFAYPNGDLDAAIHACARRHYRAAVSVENGWVEPGCDPHLLPRVNASWNRIKFAAALHRAYERPAGYFRVTPTSVSGSQVASSGNTVMRAMQSTIMKKNGSEASAT
jgi:peptidoglycan/xylan/chitin deacetylase (PgdA/CDA1 family)